MVSENTSPEIVSSVQVVYVGQKKRGNRQRCPEEDQFIVWTVRGIVKEILAGASGGIDGGIPR